VRYKKVRRKVHNCFWHPSTKRVTKIGNKIELAKAQQHQNGMKYGTSNFEDSLNLYFLMLEAPHYQSKETTTV
jgi:hypothetical protein